MEAEMEIEAGPRTLSEKGCCNNMFMAEKIDTKCLF